jgi:3-phosphoshikimate 1-carboxyvinyltransferase
MQQRVSRAASLAGDIALPGDKSISHRYAMIAAIANGDTRIHNYSTGADCHSTLSCIRELGIEVEEQGASVLIQGRGLMGLCAPRRDLDAGNSGSTIRMLSGILAAQPFRTRIAGDESLSGRPMQRIIAPLERMGASITAREGKYPPLEIEGAALRAIEYELPVASAQVKTCVLFAGLFAEGATSVVEPVRSRDHTEIALREFGADIMTDRRKITVQGRPSLQGRELTVPADLSSAAFFIVAALLAPGSSLTIRGVGLNPTRSALLDFLLSLGARIRILDVQSRNGELAGDILVQHSMLSGGVIEKELTAALIDEIPVLAVLGAASRDGLTVRDAAELRVKETDRIRSVVENLRRLGVQADELPDGMVIPGLQRFRAAELDSFGDHRIAMAFAVAALLGDGESIINGADAASISFPEFWKTLAEITAGACERN